MDNAPKWFVPVAVVALLWNLVGCLAYLSDVMLTPDDIAKVTEAQQAMHAARPAWSVGATAVAVWFGAAGSLALILKKRWAVPVLALSLVGVIVQDISIFLMSGTAQVETVAVVMQGVVLLISIALVLLARRAAAQGWIA
ncbi:MAG: hypothetical protein OEW77_04105 [Gemmatimonadota bacterium]|nr:hypothetical protein [Gemmatimonadota bacterium]